MTVSEAGVQLLTSEQDVVAARQVVRKHTQQCGFSLIDQTKLVTAASELARNAVKYGGGGEMRWELLQDGGRRGVRLTFIDQGPGISNIEQAMTDGWTSGGGLGMGLSRGQTSRERLRNRKRAGSGHSRHGCAMEVGMQLICAVNGSADVGAARRHAQALATANGFDEVEAGRIALISTELANNLVRHANGGKLLLQLIASDAGPEIEILSIDSGPGMIDAEQCLSDGYSSGGTSGTGLGAVRRLSTEFDLFTEHGKGCIVLSRVRKSVSAKTSAAKWRWGVISAPAPGENVVGDGWSVVRNGDDIHVLLADGLGHGPLACEAAQAAMRIFGGIDSLGSLTMFFNKAHESLRSTRGAAVAAARCSFASTAMTYAGVGNISGSILSRGGKTRGLMSHNGTVGAEMRAVKELPYEWTKDDRLVMHSDGLTTRWSLAAYPGLTERHPALISAVLFRDFLRGRDDATVLVLERVA